MQDKNRWLNRTRLYVTKLEDRVTPSIISGLDLGDLGHGIALPEDQNSSPALKRPKASENIQIVNPAVADVQQVTGPSKAGLSRPATTQTGQVNQANNPAMRPPQAAQQSFTNRPNVQRAPMTAQPTLTPKAIHVGGDGGTFRAGQQTPGSGAIGNNGDPRVTNYVTFFEPGSNFQDGVNEVAATTTGVAGESYACGFQGQRAIVKRMSATGVTVANTTAILGAPPLTVRYTCAAVAAHPTSGAVYIVGRKTDTGDPIGCPGGLCYNFVATGVVGSGYGTWTEVQYTTAADGVVSFEDVAVNALGDVAVTGVGVGPGYDVILDFTYTAALAPAFAGSDTVGWDFGTQTDGLTNGINALGERFIGGFLDDGAQQSPLWMNTKTVLGTPTFDWGFTATVDGAHTADDANCVCSIALNPTGDELMLSGGLDATTLAPPEGTDTSNYQGLLISQDTQAFGGFSGPYAFWYYVNGGIGSGIAGHYYARGNAIAPDGAGGFDHFTAGSVDDLADTTVALKQNNTFGDSSHFDALGGLPSFRSVGDTTLTPEIDHDTDGFGIAAFDPDGIGGADYAVYGGFSTAGEAVGAGSPFGGPFVGIALTAALDDGYGCETDPDPVTLPCSAQLEGGEIAPRDGYVISDDVPLGT